MGGEYIKSQTYGESRLLAIHWLLEYTSWLQASIASNMSNPFEKTVVFLNRKELWPQPAGWLLYSSSPDQ